MHQHLCADLQAGRRREPDEDACELPFLYHSGGGVSGGGDESSPDWAAIGIVLLGSVILGIVVSNAYANHVDEEGSSARAGVGQGGFWGEWKLEW